MTVTTMTEQDLKELNKKLAEWAGFRIMNKYRFLTPNNEVVELDYFTQSLDALFKWVVPKLTDAQRARLPGMFSHDGVFTFNGFWDDPALALCLAIEKLIDREK